MFIKKTIFLVLLFLSYSVFSEAEKKVKPPVIETIKFKDLTEFDACFLIYRAPISFNLKDMLSDYMKFRKFECTKYDEIHKRASIIRGSFPRIQKLTKLIKRNNFLSFLSYILFLW